MAQVNASGQAEHETAGRRSLGGAALVVSAAACWATFGPLARRLYDFDFRPLELASIRTWIALVGALLLARATGTSLRIERDDVVFFVLYGVLGFAAFEWLLLEAFRVVPVAIAVSLLYTAPVFVVLIARVIWQERITRGKQLALVFSLAGVVLVTGAAGALARGQTALPPAGVVFGLAAGFGYALYTVFGRSAVRRTTPVATLFWSFLFAGLVLALVAEPVRPTLRAPAALPWLLALGLLTTLLPYALFLRALRTVPAGTASLLACTEPVFATVLAAIFLGERLAMPQIAGMTLIVGAAALLVSGGPARR